MFIFVLYCAFIVLSYYLTFNYKEKENSKYKVLKLIIPKLYKNEKLYYIILGCFIGIPFFFNNNIDRYVLFGLSILLPSIYMISFIDFKSYIIPNKYILPAMFLSFIIGSFTVGIKSSLIGGFSIYFICYFFALIRFGSLGGGDLKLSSLFGFLLGFKFGLFSVLIGFILGGFFILFLFNYKLTDKKDFIPYGPFLSLAFYGTLYFYYIM